VYRESDAAKRGYAPIIDSDGRIILRKRACLGLLILFAVSCQTKSVGPKPWIPDQQVGVLTAKTGNICIQLQNSSAPPNIPIRIVNLTPPQTALPAHLGGRQDSCAAANDPSSGYAVLGADSASVQIPAIGILNYPGDLREDGDGLSADLDGDGQPEYFRACASSEGIHFTIWTGKPLTGKLRWHKYQYLGYDMSANCTAEEIEPAK